MEYVSSDTNVWIDFSIIERENLPFRLPYTYIMNTDAIEDELLSPVGLREKLLGHGLVAVEMTTEEFELAQGYGVMFPRLSVYDRIALAIAKARDIFLLTGDAALRKAAQSEQVEVKGTLGILDELVKGNHIDRNEYEHCLREMLNQNGRGIRLPKNEITLRLQKLLK